MSTHTLLPLDEQVSLLSPPELEAQQILILLSEASSEAQMIVLNRLLAGLTAKITSTVASKAVEYGLTINEPPKTTSARGGKSKPKETKQTFESQLGKLDDPLDPFEAWEKLGGAEGLALILPNEQIGVLQGMLRHSNMPHGKPPRGNTNKAVSAAILERLKQHYS